MRTRCAVGSIAGDRPGRLSAKRSSGAALPVPAEIHEWVLHHDGSPVRDSQHAMCMGSGLFGLGTNARRRQAQMLACEQPGPKASLVNKSFIGIRLIENSESGVQGAMFSCVTGEPLATRAAQSMPGASALCPAGSQW